MKVELECYGFRPDSIKVITQDTVQIFIEKNKIVIESTSEYIRCFTIQSRSVYSSKLCYLNIINPIFYLYQYKLKNDDVYFYDDNFIWIDIVLNDIFDNNLKIKLEKTTKRIKGSTVGTYEITPYMLKTKLQIQNHNIPQKQIYRYKLINIASQLFYFILLLALAVIQLVNSHENITLYLSALIIHGIFSTIKVYKFYSSQSVKNI